MFHFEFGEMRGANYADTCEQFERGPMLYIADTVTEGKEMGEEEDTG